VINVSWTQFNYQIVNWIICRLTRNRRTASIHCGNIHFSS
jgi:hypothetical protein